MPLSIRGFAMSKVDALTPDRAQGLAGADTAVRGLWWDAARRFRRNTSGLLGASILLILILAGVLAPLIAPYDPLEQSLFSALHGPSASHLFGTDQFGRDVFSRVLWGARVSLPVGLISVTIACIFGVPLGLVAGYF